MAHENFDIYLSSKLAKNELSEHFAIQNPASSIFRDPNWQTQINVTFSPPFQKGHE